MITKGIWFFLLSSRGAKEVQYQRQPMKSSVEFEIRHLKAEFLGVEGEDQTVCTAEQNHEASKSC